LIDYTLLVKPFIIGVLEGFQGCVSDGQ